MLLCNIMSRCLSAPIVRAVWQQLAVCDAVLQDHQEDCPVPERDQHERGSIAPEVSVADVTLADHLAQAASPNVMTEHHPAHAGFSRLTEVPIDRQQRDDARNDASSDTQEAPLRQSNELPAKRLGRAVVAHIGQAVHLHPRFAALDGSGSKLRVVSDANCESTAFAQAELSRTQGAAATWDVDLHTHLTSSADGEESDHLHLIVVRSHFSASTQQQCHACLS
jgi:hypothetical protein